MDLGKARRPEILAVALLLASGVDAEIYNCTDDKGMLNYQDSECPVNEHAEVMDPKQLTRKISVIPDAGGVDPALVGNRVKNAHFDTGLESWASKRSPDAFGWTENEGHEKRGAAAVQSTPPDNPVKKVIYEAELSQCVKLDQGRLYRFAASFKPMGKYKSRHANRVNLSWYQSEDCSTHGQFADYLEPVPDSTGWQRITHEDRLRSLNARAALITIVQSRTGGDGQKALWDDIDLTPTEMESSTSEELGINHSNTLPKGENYITNGDFRFNLDSWRYSGDTSWAAVAGGNEPGAARLAIFSDKGGYGAHDLSQCVNIGANRVFRAGAKVKVDHVSTQEGGGIFRLSWYENEDCRGRSQAGFEEDRVENIEGWQELTINRIEAPPNARSANIYITRGVNDSGLFAYFIDDVYFSAVSE